MDKELKKEILIACLALIALIISANIIPRIAGLLWYQRAEREWKRGNYEGANSARGMGESMVRSGYGSIGTGAGIAAGTFAAVATGKLTSAAVALILGFSAGFLIGVGIALV
mgnify:CR=1 FL=1